MLCSKAGRLTTKDGKLNRKTAKDLFDKAKVHMGYSHNGAGAEALFEAEELCAGRGLHVMQFPDIYPGDNRHYLARA